MTWAMDFRQSWIAERVADAGYIQRKDLIARFSISMQQASIDLQRFQRERPGTISYDKTAKRYVAAVQAT